MSMKVLLGCALTLTLTGCVVSPPAPQYTPVTDPYAGNVTTSTAGPGIVTPIPAPTVGISGLEERQPDACHAGDYVSALGQPASVIPTLGVTRAYKIVEYRGIESQTYDPLRIVFRLDAAGNVQNIDCG